MFYMIRSVVYTCLFANVKPSFSAKTCAMLVFCIKMSGKSHQLPGKCQGNPFDSFDRHSVYIMI